jgi:hypothetical protein
MKEGNEMKALLRVRAMLAIVLGVLSLAAGAQDASRTGPVPSDEVNKYDLAVNFTYKIPKISETTTRFILPGGSVDAACNFRGKARGLGLAVDFNGEAASNIGPGVNLTQISIAAGPRYTFRMRGNTTHPMAIYGQALGGMVFASNSVFPGPSGTVSSANSSVLQAGGGMNFRLTHSVSLRVVEADFVMTALPNIADNKQYDLRLSNGLVFHF